MVKLLTSLTEQPADNCIILTYNVDLLFFEYLVFDPLYASGCRNILVLCDPVQYEEAIQSAAQLRHAGRRYLLVPALTSPHGAFHPKLVLLTSQEGGRLLVTSGNLSRAGYTQNLEVATTFDYAVDEPDATAWRACEWAYRTARTIVNGSGCDEIVHRALEQVWGTTTWLRTTPEVPAHPRVWLCDNLDVPLLDRLQKLYLEHDGSAVRTAVIVSPYFDRDAAAFEALLDGFMPTQIRVCLDPEDSGLDPHALRSVLNRYAVDCAIERIDASNRRLHAKSLVLQTERGSWAVSGSANFSRRALLRSAAGGNTESVVIRFEQDPSHFAEWLNELATHPLDLDTLPEARPNHPEPAREPIPVRLRSAILEENELHLQTELSLPNDATIVLHVQQTVTEAVPMGRQIRNDRQGVTLTLPPHVVKRLTRPALVSVQYDSALFSGCTNAVLIHNSDALTRFTRPVSRTSRPTIPQGLVPESLEHCAEIMETLRNLLAFGPEQLDRHGGQGPRLRRQDEQEEQMAIEDNGEYDPAAHIVPEPIRRPDADITGAEIYADYYDRLTYQSLLRAALAAVFRPPPSETARPDQPDVPPTTKRIERPTRDASTEQAKSRIERSFGRLVGNFLQGLQDESYMARVTPHYLNEVYTIVLTYMRVLRHDEVLDRDHFIQYSVALLSGFWNRTEGAGAWSALSKSQNTEDIADEERRLGLRAHTWLHAYMVAQETYRDMGRPLYRLAVWMRQFAERHARPDVLASLPDKEYAHLWKHAAPATMAYESAADVVWTLHELSAMYDEESLLNEITSWYGTKAKIGRRLIAGQPYVPTLEVRSPIDEADFDRCLRAFLLFVRWPSHRPHAWASFDSTKSQAADSDLKCVRFFYDGVQGSLTFSVRRFPDELAQDVTKAVQPRELEAIANMSDLLALPSYR